MSKYISCFLIFFHALMPVDSSDDARILIFNRSHLELSWNDTDCIKDNYKFNISMTVKEKAKETERKIGDINIIQDCKEESNKYKTYIKYEEGIKYEVRTYGKHKQTLFVNTQIHLDANVTCLNDNFTVSLDVSELIIGSKIKLCIINNKTIEEDAPLLPIDFQSGIVEHCNVAGNNLTCNSPYELIGAVILNNNTFQLNVNANGQLATTSETNIRTGTSKTVLICIFAVAVVLILSIIILVIKCKYINKFQFSNLETIPLKRTTWYVPIGLEEAVKNYDQNRGLIENEFEAVETGSIIKLAANNTKNRYINTRPYEHNVVKLGPNKKYINASYIKGFKGFVKYIATQGPMASTIADFWEMVWQENVQVIVMLTGLMENDKEKCVKYWPDTTKILESLSVHYISTVNFVGYLVREFELRNADNKSRRIKQIHFVSWLDHDIPRSPHIMVNLMRHFRKLELKTPCVVHCSAGLGRTGSFILCDYMLDQYKTTKRLNFQLALQHLRKGRQGMVQTMKQYLLVYCTIFEYININPNSIPIHEYKNIASLCTKMMLTDLNFVDETDYWLNVLYDKEANPHYNRSRTNKTKTNVTGYRGFVCVENETNIKYLNAVKLINFCADRSFICIQNPLPDTINDFWELMSKENSQLIIILQSIGSNRSPIFWPANNIAMKIGNDIEITRKAIAVHQSYDLMELNLSKTGECKELEVMHFKNWNGDGYPDTAEFIEFFLKTIKNSFNNITLVCHDGSSASGIYLTMLKITEYIKVEKVFDICSPVRTLRSYRDDFMVDPEQFIFVYKTIDRYLDMDFRQNLQLPDIIEDL